MNTQDALKVMTRGNRSLEHAVNDKLNRTRLIRCLIGMRAKAGLSQTDVAQRMNCSQSRISKIEHGFDEDITIGELNAYSQAVGQWFEISFSDTSRNATGLIKYHIIRANDLLQRIIKLAEDDKEMLAGANSFSMEMLVNFCRLLDNATKKIPDSSFQKLLSEAAGKRPESFELNCNSCAEKETVDA